VLGLIELDELFEVFVDHSLECLVYGLAGWVLSLAEEVAQEGQLSLELPQEEFLS